MSGLWVFLIVTVVFGSMTSVINTAIRRGKDKTGDRELEVLRGRLAQLEGQVEDQPALPPHEEKRVGDLEHRIQALETIVTGADELLEARLRDAARSVGNKD